MTGPIQPAWPGRVRATIPDDGHIDDIAVERAMAGEPVDLTPLELITTYTRLHQLATPNREIARRLDVTERTVLRWQLTLPAYALAAAS